MNPSFKKQLRMLKKHEPMLFESIMNIYNATLFEGISSDNTSNEEQGQDESMTPNLNVHEEIHTSGIDSMMNKVHQAGGVNTSKKLGDDIFTDNDEKEQDATLSKNQEELLLGGSQQDEPNALPLMENDPSLELFNDTPPSTTEAQPEATEAQPESDSEIPISEDPTLDLFK